MRIKNESWYRDELDLYRGDYLKKYLKAFGIWLLFTPLGILNGGLRIYITEPLLGRAAMPLSGIILSIAIFALSYFLIPKIGKCETKEYIFIGVAWAVLTNIFDMVITIIENRPMSDFFKMYDITTGNLWLIVVLVTLISPVMVGRIRGK